MALHAILLFLSVFPMSGAMRPFRLQTSIQGASVSAGLAIRSMEQSGDQASGAPRQSLASRKHGNQAGPVQTFTGTVEWMYDPWAWDCDAPNCDHFALYDDATYNTYELDDARAALPFEGKRAKITGILNTKTSTIHLISIEGLK